MDSPMRKKVSKSTELDFPEQWQRLMQANYGTPSLHLVRGKGIEVWDEKGRKYFDFLGGIATNLLGHSHPAVVKAVVEQSKTLSHVSNFYSHRPGLDLAAALVQMVGHEDAKVFFCNSGAEANEAALKLSRLTGRKRIVAAQNSFHGRTMGALSLTGQPAKRNPFKPLIKNVKHVPYGDIAALRKSISKRTAMLILEPIMGEAGVVVPPSGYLKAAREICHETGTLLAIDAVQTGMGRTGSWFGYEKEAIKPDVITIAKGLGGGLPLGAMISLGSAAHLFTPGSHGTTFGGNPISCAAALAVIKEIEAKQYLALNRIKGALLKNVISPIVGVAEVRGEGLLIGVVMNDQKAKEVAQKLQERGYLVNAANDSVIRIAPAYVVSDAQIMKFATTFNEVCEEVYRG